MTGPEERNGALQGLTGLLLGVAFGFLLHKGGVTRHEVIVGQLLLEDFTVLKVMLTAVVVGSLGVHALRSLGLARLHPKKGTLGSTVPGGLLFGAGFALLGYCPGTLAGAAGQGSLDALTGGLAGVLAGAWIFAVLYPRLGPLLGKGDFGSITLPEALGVRAWLVVPAACGLLVLGLWLLERGGL